MKKTTSKFLRITCPSCSNEQIIFGKTASRIKCDSCKKLIAKPTGGKTRLLSKIEEVL